MSSVQIPRPYVRAVKGLRDWTELNKWSTGAEQTLLDIIASIEQIAAVVNQISNRSLVATALPVCTTDTDADASVSVTVEIASPNSFVVILGMIEISPTAAGPNTITMTISEASAGTLETTGASVSNLSASPLSIMAFATHEGISGAKTYTVAGSGSGANITSSKILVIEFR